MTFSDFREKCYGSKLAQIGPNYHFSFFKIIPESNLLHHTASPSIHTSSNWLSCLLVLWCYITCTHYNETGCINDALKLHHWKCAAKRTRCTKVASTMHPRCIHVASTLHSRCIHVASTMHHCTCTQAATKLQPSCNIGWTVHVSKLHRPCAISLGSYI